LALTSQLSGVIYGSGSTYQVAWFNATNSIGGSSNLYFDPTNNRLGINQSSPTYSLDVTGTARITGNTIFGGTLGNGTYTYTLPSATGTLALTSNLSSYVPYSGATGSLYMGSSYLVSAKAFVTSGSGGGAYLKLLNALTAATPESDGVKLSSVNSVDLVISSNTYNSTLITSGNTADRTYTFPNASGTIALTSNIPTLSGTAPIYYSAGVISISQATTSTNGYLSSTDWNTFNGKQNAINNPVNGLLTNNYIPVGATGSYMLINSSIYQGTSGYISIGNTNNTYNLDVTGTGRFTGTLTGNQLKVANTTGTTLDMLVLETAFSNPSGNKSIIWKDATSPVGRISVSYDASTGSTMRFGSLYNGGYQSSDLLTLASTGAATFSSSVTANTIIGVVNNGAQAAVLSAVMSYSDGYRATLRLNNTYTGGKSWEINSTNNSDGLYGGGKLSFLNSTDSITAMTLTSSGNVGIGTTSPSGIFEVVGNTVDTNFGFFSTTAATNRMILAARNTGNNAEIDIRAHGSSYSETILGNSMTNAVGVVGAPQSGAAMVVGPTTNSPLILGTYNAERMRITSGGNVLIGNTTDAGYKLRVNGPILTDRQGYAFPSYSASGTWQFGSDPSVGNGLYMYFTATGYQLTLSSSGVLYTAGGGTSDRRTKENITAISNNAISFINELKPVSFEFITDKTKKTRRGFIAQDVLETSIPSLVLGNGNEEGGTYGLDYDGILALAVKAIQEQQAQIEELKSFINK
jgi:hypothetical protein